MNTVGVQTVLVLTAFAVPLSIAGVGRAQSISMTPAPATPELHGPFLHAARPATPLLFTIPATGQAPLAFTATGLPAGLALGSDTGTISGTTPAGGSYPVVVTVSNGAGKTTATYTIVASNSYALTPPMGWNSYDSFGAGVKENEFLEIAQAVKTQLQPYGWNTVVIDYLWFDSEQATDANGRWVPSTSKWPSSAGNQGLKAIGDKVHALGLSFGIHIMRGIPRKSFTANTPIAGSTYKAADAGNSGDTCPWDSHNYGVRGDTAAGQAWYDAIFAQYAGWGIDFVKVDDMVSGSNYHQAEVQAIRAAIDKTGRSIVLSLSPGPMQTRDTANLNANANMWRTVNDFWDTNGLSNLTDVFNAAGNWQMQTPLTQGHWPDCDMLPLGYVGPRPPVGGAARMSALSHNEQLSVMSLWGVMPSPLMLGGNPTRLSTDGWTTALLTNPEVLAVNQDASGTHGKRLSSSGNTQVWSRDLVGGRKAVAMFNRGSAAATVSVTFSQLGVAGTPSVRDVWQRTDVAGATTGISTSVPGGGAMLYVVSPAGAAGTGGAGGAAATGGSSGGGGSAGVGRGGSLGSGGTAGAGGAGDRTGSGGVAAGSAGTTGNAGTTGRAGSSGGAGTTGDAGTHGIAGASGPTGFAGTTGAAGRGGTGTGAAGTGVSGAGGSASGEDAGGCSCTTAGGGGTGAPFLGLLGAIVLLRRRRQGSPASRRGLTRSPAP